MTSTSNLPWLQDTTEEPVWKRWQVQKDDIQILDSQNQTNALLNLGYHDLSYATNQAALKQLFLSAARVTDADQDQLPDDWERRYFANLGQAPRGDFDGDGSNNFAEFAFGNDPTNAQSRVSVRPVVVAYGGQQFLSVTFRRRAGAVLDYLVEVSRDLKQWNSTEVLQVGPPRNLFDGTGTSEVTYRTPLGGQSQTFLRVRAAWRPGP